MADRPDDLRASGRSACPPSHLVRALRLSAVAVAHATAALLSQYRDSLGTGAARSRGEWPFRGPADGPRSAFSQRWKDQR
jgi:hypothetical protein